jgi:hypothetical protein
MGFSAMRSFQSLTPFDRRFVVGNAVKKGAVQMNVERDDRVDDHVRKPSQMKSLFASLRLGVFALNSTGLVPVDTKLA